MQNLNQKTEAQRENLAWKRSRAHRIQKNVMEIFIWLQRADWCEETVLEQSATCRSLGANETFGELKRQFHGALVPGCQWGLKSGISVVEKLVFDYEDEDNVRCLGSKSVSGRPLP